MTLTIGQLTNFGFFFPVACFASICLAKPYRNCPGRDKGLYNIFGRGEWVNDRRQMIIKDCRKYVMDSRLYMVVKSA